MSRTPALPFFLLAALAAGCGSSDAGGDAPPSSDDAGLGDASVDADAGSGEAASDASADAAPPVRADLLAHVDPFISTGGVGFGIGSGYPGPALPFAMIHPGPDTRVAAGASSFQHCSGYSWDDDLVTAFSLVRMHGTGVPDYGNLGIMPVVGVSDAIRNETGRMAKFAHADESASVGRYATKLATGVGVEITSTARAAAFRFTFPAGVDPVIVLDPSHAIGTGRVEDPRLSLDASTASFDMRTHAIGDLSDRIGGFELFAHGVTSAAPVEVGTFDASAMHAGDTAIAAAGAGGWMRFASGTTSVELRVAVSFVDAAGARSNLDAEMPAFAFDATLDAARAAWKTELDRFEVFGIDDREATIVGTSLYHAELMPTLMSDVDGRAVAVDRSIVTSATPRYSDFSLWDTYRTLHPWLLFLDHPSARVFAASLVQMGVEGGNVPRWSLAHGDVKSMNGTPGEIVLAESAAKGALDDEAHAFEVARRSAFGPPTGPAGGRSNWATWLAHGYVPSDVSETEEYAIADGVLAEWATRRGETADAATLAAHARFYTNLWDPSVGFFRGKDDAGAWSKFLGPTIDTPEYTEGDAWQYLWLAPHDLDGLVTTLGGKDAALARLDEYFAGSMSETPILGKRKYYWPGNEPDIMAPWLYAAFGARDRGAAALDWAVDAFYGTGPDGLPGNDDGGTLSAWRLFASTGLYPIAGTDRYVVGTPRHPKVVVHRPDGTLTIVASPDPSRNRGVASVTLDGTPIVDAFVRHASLEGDHVLAFSMRELAADAAP